MSATIKSCPGYEFLAVEITRRVFGNLQASSGPRIRVRRLLQKFCGARDGFQSNSLWISSFNRFADLALIVKYLLTQILENSLLKFVFWSDIFIKSTRARRLNPKVNYLG